MSSHCDRPGLLPVSSALTTLLDAVNPVHESEHLPLHKLNGRVIAESITSPINVPGFANSAMDGYALRSEDNHHQSSLRVIGKSFAGQPFTGQVNQGECVRIMTGAKMPSGADAVVMQENTTVHGDTIAVSEWPKKGESVRPVGDDIAIGSTLLEKGHKLSAIDIGLIASVGITEALVFRPIKVALFSSGDELRQPGEALPDGCIYDSNRRALHALLAQMGAEVIDLGVVKDDKEAIRDAFLRADSQADAVITSGGVSVGEADFIRDVLDEIGSINFWKLAMKPGKPLAFGKLPSSYFFGLPGNPVSSMVTFHQVALPGLRKLSGQQQFTPLRLSAVASKPFRKRPGRLDYQRGLFELAADGSLAVAPHGKQSSGVLSAMSQANCFVVLEAQRGDVEAGEKVIVEPFDEFLKAR
ncbi:molybdopterin molybdotransferase MoeA [Aestuariibacter salexigens]|uniref:molybdopterin molybdotransferase MoeA n=1 Tax=Aestuariibacter salexigens TaxID=226010 RepID=UPI000410E03E|nr:molybdopterin molybdotransferase MoeA [Aestuariibacter salexigens]